MGVPAFYRWLTDKYPRVVQDVDKAMQDPNGVKYDNLYLDMNAIIHPCFHPDSNHDDIPLPTTFEDVFRNVFDYIDRLVDTVRPRKLVYMAIDGIAPRAKMNQQRSRRFRAAKDKEIHEAEEERLRKQFEMEGKQVLPKQESEVEDFNVITPGTEFMHELSKALKGYISTRINCNSLWKDIMVILSDANVPGEGEHKIMSYIRKQRTLEEYDPNTCHCLYGLDADLIMLALATHEPHFSILREVIHVQDVSFQQQPKVAAKPFKLLHIWLLREYIELDMKIENPPKTCSVIKLERIIDDFIFMCFFAGNDFLPHLPSLDIREGAIDLLMTVYKEEFSTLGGHLVDMNRVGEKNAAFMKLSRVENFILKVGTYEEKIFKKRSEIRERKLKRLIRDYEDARREEKNEKCFFDLDDENTSDCTLLIKKAPDSKLSLLANNVSATHAEIEQNTKDLKDELKKSIRQKGDLLLSEDFLVDKIKLGAPGYKERYYKAKFSVETPTDIEGKRKEIVQKYTEGLAWVLQYYFSAVASWTWFYPFHYGPFVSDLKGMSQVRVKFEKGVPFLPLDQLLSVLPPGSAHALPKAYAQLMLDEKSRILDFYPQDFEVDTEGKRFTWQGICKLPWIDDTRLVAETKELKNELSEKEAIRNSLKADSLFVRSSSKLAEKFGSLSVDPNCKIDTRISDGIGGTISPCHEEACLDLCDNKEDRVLCVYYELPAGSNHIPCLLSNVSLPEKKIFEGDIMETELWHERQRNFSRSERVQTQDKWRSENKSNSSRVFSHSSRQHERSFSSNGSSQHARSFSSNANSQHGRSFSSNANSQHGRSFSSNAPSFIHKGAGVGWGSGRGRKVDTVKNERIPSHEQHNDAGSYHVTTTSDTTSQLFVNDFRQFRISESGRMNQSKNAYNHEASQSERPFGRGQGRGASSSISLRPQWSGATSQQGKDRNRW
ncbi:5'-3' exoribonuclease 3-like [Vigna umbellata]|uniref:5'-3' exoribonuclease 3-like n=1 Tax=Vigna umbellata TaxID=87088 RepID=UPI001F5FD875|nr:5'-3' exoribonuclease 3-like [Vigna umbellata]